MYLLVSLGSSSTSVNTSNLCCCLCISLLYSLLSDDSLVLSPASADAANVGVVPLNLSVLRDSLAGRLGGGTDGECNSW